MGIMSGDRRYVENACERFGLGTVTGRPLVVEGGLSNRLHHVVTDWGEYAVKRMVANADSDAFKQNVEASFAVERLAHAAGVAMPEPVPVPGSTEALGRIDHDGTPCWVRVHRWVSATPLTAESIEPGDIGQVGSILASLHRLPASSAKLLPAPPTASPDRDWREALPVRAERPAPRLDLAAVLDGIDFLEGIVRDGYRQTPARRVLSHRDFDTKNVLRDESGSLIVIDWDAAGPVNAQWDVIGVAMDWSGIRESNPSRRRFTTLLDGYVAAGGALDPLTPASFTGWAEGVLDWFWFNLERFGADDRHERGLGRREVEATARFLPRAARWIMDWR